MNIEKTKQEKKPWPTKNAMEQVYKMKLWGDNNSNFYSGEGSHNLKIVTPYLETIISFLNSFKEPITICDLGCGDFNVGKELVSYSKKYIAVDIVQDLIDYNRVVFKDKNLEFRCLDLSKDNLPYADCAMLRQVLQHLSNREIHKILLKLANFKYVFITEHIPEGNFMPNKDIISGQGTRLKKQSGLDVLAAPFNLKVKEQKEVLKINLENTKGIIITTLYTLF